MLSFLFQLLHLFIEVRQYVLAFISQFDQCLQVVNVLCQSFIQLDILIEAAAPLQDRLRFFLIVPKFRPCNFLFELDYFSTLVFGIKDTLAPAVSFPRWCLLFPEVLRASNPPKSFVCESLRDEMP